MLVFLSYILPGINVTQLKSRVEFDLLLFATIFFFLSIIYLKLPNNNQTILIVAKIIRMEYG